MAVCQVADDSTDSAVHTTRLITYHRGDSTPRGLRVHPPTRLRPTLTHTHTHTHTHAHEHAHTHSRTRTHPITPRPGLSAPTARCDLVTSPGARRRGLARPPRHTAPHLARPRGLAHAHCIIQSGPEPSGTDFAPVSQSYEELSAPTACCDLATSPRTQRCGLAYLHSSLWAACRPRLWVVCVATW